MRGKPRRCVNSDEAHRQLDGQLRCPRVAAWRGGDLHATAGLFLVAPDARESEVRAQIARPAFSRIADLEIAYLPYDELERHKESISRFGSGLKAIKAISRALP